MNHQENYIYERMTKVEVKITYLEKLLYSLITLGLINVGVSII